MRTIDSRHQALFLSRSFATHLRVTIGGQDMTDLEGHSWVESAKIQTTVDRLVSSANITLTRRIYNLSLATLMSDSKLNDGGAVVDVAKTVEIETAITPVGAQPLAGDWISAFKGKTHLVAWQRSPIEVQCRDLAGDLEDNFIKVQRLYGAAAPGDPVEDVMQDILDDNNTGVTLYSITGDGGTPFKAADSPGWNLLPYKQSKQSVLAALKALAQQIGWDLRYLWNTSTGDWELTFYEPQREMRARGTLALTGQPIAAETFTVNATPITAVAGAPGANQFQIGSTVADTCDSIVSTLNDDAESANLKAWRVGNDVLIEWNAIGTVGNTITFTEALTNATADGATKLGGTIAGRDAVTSVFTFDAGTYESLTRLEVSSRDVRNDGKVVILDSSTGDRTAVTREDATSIAKYGRRYIEAVESSAKGIDTISEGQTMVNTMIDDLKEPDAIMGAPVTGAFPWAELGDLYKFQANGEHFDSDQTLAVQAFAIVYQERGAVTSLSLQGKPAGGAKRWFEIEGGRGAGPAIDEYADAAADNMTITAGLVSIIVEFDDPRAMSPPVDDWAYTRCYVGVTPGFTPASANLVATGRQTRFEIHGLIPGTTYYSKCIHIDGVGNPSATSAQVTTATQKVGAYHENPDTIRVNLVPNGDFGQATLAIATNPPDGFEVTVGDWGVADEVYYSSTISVTGRRAVGLGDLGGGDGRILSDFIPVSNLEPYALHWYVSSPDGFDNDNRAAIGFRTYTNAQTFVAEINLGNITPTTSFSRFGTHYIPSEPAASTVRFVRMWIERNEGAAPTPANYRIFCDRMHCFKAMHKFFGFNDGAPGQAIASGAQVVVQCDREKYDLVGQTIDGVIYGIDTATNKGRFTCLQIGEYVFHAAVTLDTVTAGTQMEIGFLVNGAQGPKGELRHAAANGDQRIVAIAGITLVRGDYVEVYVEHNEGVALNIVADINGNDTFFSGARTPGDE